jgi:hypothetical protein
MGRSARPAAAVRIVEQEAPAVDGSDWLALCYRALGVDDALSGQDQRRAAEHALLDRSGLRADILGIGAAEAAIDLVVRYGEAGELDQVMLLWEHAESLGPEIAALGDEGTRRATLCAKRLLADVVAPVEAASGGGGAGEAGSPLGGGGP